MTTEDVKNAVDAYNAAVEARRAAEQAETDAKTHLGIVAAAAAGLHIGNRVTGGRKGEEFEISHFDGYPIHGGAVGLMVYGRRITKSGVPSKGEPQYIDHWGDRTTIAKVETDR